MSNQPTSNVKQRQPTPTQKGRLKNQPEHRDESTTETTDTTEHCPECDGTLIEDAEHGETVCRDCGLVVDEAAIDHGPEWRSFNSQDRQQKRRVGAPTTETLHDRGLSTNIGWQNKDSNGNPLSSKKRKRISRLRTWQERSKTQNNDRRLKEAFGEINRMSSALGTSQSSKETACVMFRRAQQEELLPGRSLEAMASGVLYAAARMEGNPRTLEEVTTVSRVERREIGRAYWYLNKELGLEVGPTDPLEFIPRLVSDVDATDETEQIAREWIEKAKQSNTLSGCSPSGVAASALYAAGQLSGSPLTQKELGEAADVTPVTVRNQLNNLIDYADITWL